MTPGANTARSGNVIELLGVTTVKVSYTIEGSALGNRPVHGEIEVSDEELAGLDDQARDALVSQWVENEVNNQVQWGWDIIQDDAKAR